MARCGQLRILVDSDCRLVQVGVVTDAGIGVVEDVRDYWGRVSSKYRVLR